MRRRLLINAMLFAGLSITAWAQVPRVAPNLIDAPRLFEKGTDALSAIGPSRDEQQALSYFQRAGELGYAPAQTVLGYFYETGMIVAADPGQALDWYKKAGKQNDHLGNWLAGRLYLKGGTIERDLNAAEPLLQKSAFSGDPYGQYLLGLVKLERDDYPKAAQLFRQSAMQGLPQAQQQLGKLLKDGKGVPANKFEAYVWMLISYDAGNLTVAEDLQELRSALGITQAEQATSKAKDMEETVTRAVGARGCTGWTGEFDALPAPPPPEIQTFCHQ